jgi:hypothetical protein
METDILLDQNTYDLKIENYDLALTSEPTIAIQKTRQALLLFQGEWFLDDDAGMPYYQEILGSKSGLDRVQTLFIRGIKSVPEIKDILSFSLDFEDRKLSISFQAVDIYNNTINGAL